jgi:RNA polymerase sigma-70 factor (ECF subfamily)
MRRPPDVDPPRLLFEDWYRAEFPRVRQAMTLVTGDPGLAEDAAAEAFALAYARWSRVGRMESPGGWVHTTALNQVRRSWRRTLLERRHRASSPAEHVPPPELPDTAVWRAVATLSPRARTAVALRYVADLTEAQVADAMNVTRGTVATTRSRARRELADALCTETTGSPS